MSQIKQKLKILGDQRIELENQRIELENQLKEQRANKVFECACCSKLHKIKDCVAIQTYWYTQPSGCMGGDYWNEGELQIVCPLTDSKNRILFTSNYSVEYSKRGDYKYSADQQFKNLYIPLFSSIIEDYKDDHRPWANCYYFDNHRADFDLHVEGID
jgi:hypothetical protein